MEPGHTEECGVGDGRTELLGGCAVPDGFVDGGDGNVGIVFEDRFGQVVVVGPGATDVVGLFPKLREIVARFPDHGCEVDGVAPGVEFFASPSRGHALDEAGEDLPGVFPSDVVEEFEGFVAEVDNVSAVDVDTVGGGGEDDVVDVALGQAEVDGGPEYAFGAIGVSDFDEIAEPLFEDFGSGFTSWQGFDDEARWSARTLGGYLSESLVEGSGLVIGMEEVEEVGGAGEHAEGGSPAFVGVRGAECCADSKWFAVVGRG